jgi:hypothetical protein
MHLLANPHPHLGYIPALFLYAVRTAVQANAAAPSQVEQVG